MGYEDLVARRRNKAIAIILAVKERECDAYLPPEAQERLRKAVLDQLNEFAEYVVAVGPSSESVVVNEHWVQKIDEIYAAVVGNAVL